jgi:tetratricopeptide (TPR) repeat protein
MADENVGLRLDVSGTEQYVAAANNVDRLGAQFVRLSLANQRLDTAMVQTGRGFVRSGEAVMNTAMALDDLQYGIRGVVNNIPMLLSSLGLGAGLAGIISIVAIGVNQLTQRWDDISSLWRDTAADEAVAKMAKLAEATQKATEAKREQIKTELSAPQRDQQKQVLSALQPSREEVARILAEGSGPDFTLPQQRRFNELQNRARMRGMMGRRPLTADEEKELAGISAAGREQSLNFQRDRLVSAESDPRAMKNLIEELADALKALEARQAPPGQLNAARGYLDRLQSLTPEGRRENAIDAFTKAIDSARDGLDRWMTAETVARLEDRRLRKEALEKEIADQRAAAIGRADAAEEMARIGKDETRLDRSANMQAQAYGQSFIGAGAVRTMLSRASKGESFNDIEASIREQMYSRLSHIQDPTLRARTAVQFAEMARTQAEDMAMMNQAGMGVMAANMSANMAPPNTAMGRFQRSMLARQTLIGGQAAGRQLGMLEQADGRIPNWTGKMDQTADKFGMAVDRLLTRGIQITL